jgi:hypothetical protein
MYASMAGSMKSKHIFSQLGGPNRQYIPMHTNHTGTSLLKLFKQEQMQHLTNSNTSSTNHNMSIYTKDV